MSSGARGELSTWLEGDCGLSAELIATMKGWLAVGSGSLSLGAQAGSGASSGDVTTSVGSGNANLILTGSASSDLSAFIGGSAFGGLDTGLQGVLHGCAAGGAAGTFTIDVQASFASWLSSSSCPLESGLKGYAHSRALYFPISEIFGSTLAFQ